MKVSAEGAAQQSPGRRRRSRPELWVESAEVGALKGMRVKLMGVISSAEGAAQQSPGRGREAAEALGWRWGN